MLTFTGVGSAFNTQLGNTSAWIRQGTHLLLLDCGGTVFERILKTGLLEGITSLDIAITHTHGDHVGSLGDLILYCHFKLEIKPTVRHPERGRIQLLLMLLGVPEETYELDDASEFALGWLDGRFIPQDHADTMPAYGLRLVQADRTAWYSGDSNSIPPEVLEDFLNGRIACLYQDASGRVEPDSPHMSLEQLTALIPEPLRNKVVCMHQDEAFSRETAQNSGFRVAQTHTGLSG